MRKVLIVFLCLLLLGSVMFVGCSKTNESTTSPSLETTDEKDLGENEEDNTFVDGPLVPYEDTVVIEVAYELGANVMFAEGESIDNNFVTQMYKDYLNIEYKPKWIVDTSKAAEKMNTAIASNDLPDVFTANAQMLGRLIESEQVQVLNDVYENYATPEFKEIAEYQEKRGFLMGQVGTDYYAIPASNDFANNVAMYYIRSDWMEELGLEEPKTLDDVINIAKAFKEKNPGNVDESLLFPINMDKNFGDSAVTLKLFANPMGAYYDQWVLQDDDTLAYGSLLPEMRDTLLMLQQCYKDGLFDPEFAVKDSGKTAQDIAAGNVGIYPGVFWSALWPLAGSIDNVEGADWKPYPIPVNNSGVRQAQNTLCAYFGVAVREGYEHPEALVKSMNLWAEIFHYSLSEEAHKTLSQEKYLPVVDNWHVGALPVFFAHPEKNLKLSANFIDIWNAQDPSLALTPEAANRWDIIQAGGSGGWAHLKFLTEAEPVLNDYDEYVYEEFVGAPTETMLLMKPNLDKMQYETFVKIIMGDPIENFDKYVEDWYNQGGQQITDEVNAWYKTVK